MLFKYIRSTSSRKNGVWHSMLLRSDSISGIILTLRAYLESLSRSPLSSDCATADLDTAKKQARHEDGPPGDRAVTAPLRAAHIKAAFAGGLGRSSPAGIIRAAGLLAGHNLLARDLDLAVTGRVIDPSRDLTIAVFD